RLVIAERAEQAHLADDEAWRERCFVNRDVVAADFGDDGRARVAVRARRAAAIEAVVTVRADLESPALAEADAEVDAIAGRVVVDAAIQRRAERPVRARDAELR